MAVFRLPIQIKFTILATGIVIFSILIGGIIQFGNFQQMKENELRKRVMITARTVAQLPEVKEHLSIKQGWSELNPMIERIRIINHVDYIVVLDESRTRYSHPVETMLGTKSKGKDEGPAFAEHTYISKAKGELGVAIRSFVPILNDKREQIGVVIVGSLLPTFYETIYGIKNEIAIVFFLTLLFGAFGSWLLASHIKEQMFRLEPHEIVRILVERTATFHAMHEGVIAIDNQENITVFNDKAKKMLGIEGDVVGKQIREVIPDTRLPEMLQLEKPIHNQEIQVNQTNIMSNRVPIKVNGETVGAVAIFQDRTEVREMAEELTGVKAFVEALRVQNHEHMNKLHTIAGLIQLGNEEKALNYVFQVTEEQEELTNFLNKIINNDNLAGLLLSKVRRGRELGIKVSIDPNSRLKRFPNNLDHNDFVLILGNLIENAFTALEKVDYEDKRIDVSIEQNDEVCEILVEDNGCGISEEDIEHIFRKGFTTNDIKGNGLGLYLVQSIVKKGEGEIEVTSKLNEGTSLLITFPMNS
jgi:two-component system, CitB family, sensor histidine kinase DctS